MKPSRVLGQLLLAGRHITEEQLNEALEVQRETRERIGDILVRQGLPARSVAQALARQLRLPYLEPPLLPEAGAIQLVDHATASRLRVVPLAARERLLRVAMADPLDMAAVDDLQFRTGRRVEPVVTEPAAIEAALASYEPGTISALINRIPLRAQASDNVEELRRASEAAPVVSLADHIFSAAIRARASDIHIEPRADAVVVRIRVDGALRELLRMPAHIAAPLVSRVKVMAALDISVKRRPQDGRLSVTTSGRETAMRVSTLPANGAETVVLRLLDTQERFASLAALGMQDDTLTIVRRMLRRSHGVILVTGPTGSGKSTTLFAALNELDRCARNIITLEDPVEYKLAGITQVQVHRRAGLSFPRALRAVLRQDPDTIMVGELRDRETVEVALAAALTGHLVLSTLHTNDAPSAITRLLDMGAPPYLIAGSLIGVVAQRLLRKCCVHCTGRGCDECGHAGYRGRVGAFEILTVDSGVRDQIMRRASADAVRALARRNGMIGMGEDARRKVEAGVTTPQEAEPLLALLEDEAPLRTCSCGKALELSWRWCPVCGHSA